MSSAVILSRPPASLARAIKAAVAGSLFELIQLAGDGNEIHRWRLFADGRVEGFPADTYVLNRAAPLLDVYRAYLTPEAPECLR